MLRAEDYEKLKWSAKPNESLYPPRKIPLELDIAIHPNLTAGRIIFNYPGSRGHIDGFADKYIKLSQYIQGENLAAVVRCGNTKRQGFTWDTNLRQMINYSLEHAGEISGTPDPEILLMGASAGASTIAAIAHEYTSVTKILLLAPSHDIGHFVLQTGLPGFQGEVYTVIGREDEIVGVRSGQIIHDWATGASHRELHIIPNCDHQFRGTINGRIMSQAPFYAFTKAP